MAITYRNHGNERRGSICPGCGGGRPGCIEDFRRVSFDPTYERWPTIQHDGRERRADGFKDGDGVWVCRNCYGMRAYRPRRTKAQKMIASMLAADEASRTKGTGK